MPGKVEILALKWVNIEGQNSASRFTDLQAVIYLTCNIKE